MITKLALLPRIFPALFRRLPAVTSVGYRMPCNRYFFAGISFSAALHAAVLFGIKPPPFRSTPPEVTIVESGSIDLGTFEEEPPPPPDPGTSTNQETQAAEVGEARASIAELPSHPEPGSIVMTGVRLDPGKAPNKENIRWEVPKNPGTGSGPGAKTGTYILAELDKIPVVTSRVSPRYPFELKQRGVTGTAVLRFVVDSRGEVSEVEVISATEPEFGKTAADAMEKWKFRAGMKDGRRVSTRMEMPINFALGRDV